MKKTCTINRSHPDIRRQAAELAEGCKWSIKIAENGLEWIRDNIDHSRGIKRNPVTDIAADTFRHSTGY